jgi:hypothetical protein
MFDLHDGENCWSDENGRPLNDYTPEERVDRDLRSMASFVQYMSDRHQGVLLDWMRSHPNSDFVQWLRSFEHTGL